MTIRVGVVGCRGIGTTHATSHKNDALAELVAVCDIIKERADELAAKLGVKAYYSLTDMLANEDLTWSMSAQAVPKTAAGTSSP